MPEVRRGGQGRKGEGRQGRRGRFEDAWGGRQMRGKGGGRHGEAGTCRGGLP